MQTIDLEKYVADLELREPGASFPVSRDVQSALVEGEQQSFLNDRSVVSFASGVSGPYRRDVLNSVLLAQLAANKKFPAEEQLLEWYREFIHVLGNLGWTIQAAEFSTYKASKDIFEVENVVIDILTSAFGSSFANVIAKTLDSIKSLSDADGKLKVFEKNTHSVSKGVFQLALASEENGTVSLQMGSFLLAASGEIKKILFFRSSRDKVRLDYCSRTGTLNEEVYAGAREAIQEKLGQKLAQFVAEIEI